MITQDSQTVPPLKVDISPKLFSETQEEIRRDLLSHGLDFEGKLLPVSLVPTVIEASELERVVKPIQVIRRFLNQVIDEFVAEHRQGRLGAPLHQFYKPYRRWWDLIAGESRTLPQINLMRYDAILDAGKRWSIIETNTACPGGTINCSRVRKAWLATPLGCALSREIDLVDFPIDSPDGFVLHLARTAEKASGVDAPNIALCTYKGFYFNELDNLQTQHRLLKERGLVGGELFICDIRELSSHDGQTTLKGRPIHLIHNKLDPLMIDPRDPEIEAWLAASRSDKTQFLNGLGAFYLTEAKRVLALLADPVWRMYLGGTAELEESVSLIPFTGLAADWSGGRRPKGAVAELSKRKDLYVLKPDALTRGKGITIGVSVDARKWARSLAATRRRGGVIQKRVDTPERLGAYLRSEGRVAYVPEYFGIDLFLFGEEFAGPVSRCHTELIFNVGNGGKLSPTLVTRPARTEERPLQ